jgi:hypothetical protein
MAPRVLVAPRDLAHSHYLLRRTTVDTRIIREPDSKVVADKRLARLEERFRHELMDDEERQELRDRVLRLRRRLSR